MKVHNDLNNLPEFRHAVLTIGSFDGVHEGHQKIIERMNRLAREQDGESILITFHPHPRLVIYPNDDSLRLITTIDEKIQLLEQYGLDHVVIVPFTIEFSQQSADEYIQKFLLEKFNPSTIVIGYDHRFGVGRQGDINYLRWHAEREGFTVVEIEKHEVENMAISSTKIRKALDAGDIEQATRLLGHTFTLTGTVVHGQRIGNSIGFPTANLEISQRHKLIPPNGIYAVRVRHQNEQYGGMLYIGDRPTLKEYNNRTIEVNIFDFDQEIYGDKLQLEFIDFIREDSAFTSLEDLSAQLAQDREAAMSILKTAAPAGKKPAQPEVLPAVAVVILNFNGKQWLERFLPELRQSTYDNFSIVVADNGSTDGSLAFLAEVYPDIRRIDLDGNHGFAQGYNLALDQIDSDYFVLLNSDVEVTPAWMDPIVELLERDQTIAACQPKIRSFTQRSSFEYAGASGGWIDFLGYPFCRGRIFSVCEEDKGQYDNTQEIFWASGAALFIRADLFRAIGGFDPDYFAHAEEIDLCWRLKRAGYKIMVRPRSVVYHVGGGTLNYNTPRKTYLNFRNTLFTVLKNEPLTKLLWLLPARLLLDGLAGVLFLAQGKLAHIGSIVRAHWAFFTRIPQTWRKRKQCQEWIDQCSISDQPNLSAVYPRSIVWQFFARGKRRYNQL
mgnify:CR=1 FL=1